MNVSATNLRESLVAITFLDSKEKDTDICMERLMATKERKAIKQEKQKAKLEG